MNRFMAQLLSYWNQFIFCINHFIMKFPKHILLNRLKSKMNWFIVTLNRNFRLRPFKFPFLPCEVKAIRELLTTTIISPFHPSLITSIHDPHIRPGLDRVLAFYPDPYSDSPYFDKYLFSFISFLNSTWIHWGLSFLEFIVISYQNGTRKFKLIHTVFVCQELIHQFELILSSVRLNSCSNRFTMNRFFYELIY